MLLKKILITFFVSAILAPGILAECPQVVVDNKVCTNDESGPNGDGRTYCHYSCPGGSEVVVVIP